MISRSPTKRFFSIFIPSLIGHLLLFTFPIEAATFTSLAQYDVELNNIDPSPQDIFARGDGDVKTIADDGFLSSSVEAEANFLVTPTDISAFSKSKTLLFGTANNYLGNIQFLSSLLGSFSIRANDSLRFSIGGFLELFNTTNDLASSNLSSSIKINLLLRDQITQNETSILQVLGVINTNSDLQLSKDLFSFQLGPDTVLDSYSELTSFGGMNEVIQNSFSGLFQKQFTKDTQLDLILVTQSCNYTSNIINVCVKIPESSNKFILIDLFVWLILVRLIMGTMK